MKIISLFRPLNLVVIAATMLLLRYCVVIPLLTDCGLQPYLSTIHFILLTLSVVLIAAGGYVINDICDVEMDKVNKPSKVIVGSVVSEKQATLLYYVCSVVGIILGIYVSVANDVMKMASIHLLCVGLLWIYATTLKKRLLIGNIAVALMASLVPMLVAFYEPILFFNINEEYSANVLLCLLIITAYAAFSFALNFIREIIKDAEDESGDRIFGAYTLPIAFGTGVVKSVAIAFSLIIMAVIAWVQFKLFGNDNRLYFDLLVYCLLLFVQLPMGVLVFQLIRAHDKKWYNRASLLCKAVMIGGLLCLFILQKCING